MPIDKVLHKIQNHINELAPALEVFVEESIQPTVDDCEQLQKQLVLLQEYLAVYKFQKLDKEISPSFHIHARLSEIDIPPVAEVPKVEKQVNVSANEVVKDEIKDAVMDTLKSNDSSASRKQMAIGINDKFRFINELFSRNASEYGIAIEQLNTVSSWHDAEVYLHSLKSLYQWREHDEITRMFYSLVKKRFD
jgi:hypothetical protein